MSLLNDALRKKRRSLGQAKKTNLFRADPAPRRTGKARIYGLVTLIVFLSAFTVLGVWYGFLRADTASREQKLPKRYAVREEKINYEPAHPPNPLKIPVKEETKAETVIAGTIEQKEEKTDNTILEQKVISKSSRERVTKPSKKKILKAKEERNKEQKQNIQKATEVASDSSSHRSEDLFYDKAIGYHRRNNLEMAIQMYLEVLRKNPEHPDALLNLSSAYIQASLFLKAYILLQRIKSFEPENPQVFLNLAIAEIGLGRTNKAITYLERAESLIDEPQFEIYFHRGVALSHLDRLDEALVWYKKAEALCPNHPLLLFNMAVAYDKLEIYDEALRYYVTLLKNGGGSLPLEEEKEVEARIGVVRVYMAHQ